MSKPINCLNAQNPAYSGITINITNPTIKPPSSCNCAHCNPQNMVTNPLPSVSVNNTTPNYMTNAQQAVLDKNIYQQQIPSNTYTVPEYSYYNHQKENIQEKITDNNILTTHNNSVVEERNSNFQNNSSNSENAIQSTEITNNKVEDVKNQIIDKEKVTEKIIDSNSQEKNNTSPSNQEKSFYQPQYYLNNYNYVQNGVPASSQNNIPQQKMAETTPEKKNIPNEDSLDLKENSIEKDNTLNLANTTEDNLDTSKEIINELEVRAAEEKEIEKNSKKTKIIALTNEYIMSLENYLNNPNKEIRLMASKEILTRLDEDKDRYDDAALNALLNKMLQDPEKLIRIAALSALSSQLASGNDYTVKLLNDIQNNPRADKEDVIEAANILLKMSSTTEIKYNTQIINQEPKTGENK